MRRARRHEVRGPRPIEVGTSIDGYRIERIVSARPGLNVVAVAAKLGGERLTLDITSTDPHEDRKMRRRVPRLASTRRLLTHPNALRVLRVRDGGRRLHLAPLPPGTATLADWLRDGPLTPRVALTLLGEVAGALETARTKGLLHRSLSSRAILVTATDPPKALLTDFGIGTPDAAACTLAGAVDDVDHRSPEEIRGEPVRPESNVYSLACILVEALTGEPPFPRDRPLLTVHAHLAAPPPRVSERRPELAPALDDVLAKAMAKDPSKRHSSPGALIRAAEESLALKVPIPVLRPARKPVEQRPAPAPKPASEPAPVPTRPRAPAPPRRRRARRPFGLVPRAAPAWIGLLLIASAVAGFAAGNPGGSGGSASQVDEPAAGPRVVSTADAAQQVDRVFDRLDARRAAARARLGDASRPERQAATARALADAHRSARVALVRAPGRQRMEAQLTERLREVELAYRRLAAAARRGDPSAWRTFREETLDREVDLELLLRTT